VSVYERALRFFFSFFVAEKLQTGNQEERIEKRVKTKTRCNKGTVATNPVKIHTRKGKGNTASRGHAKRRSLLTAASCSSAGTAFFLYFLLLPFPRSLKNWNRSYKLKRQLKGTRKEGEKNESTTD